MREIKFRAWVPKEKVMVDWEELIADQYEFNEFNNEGGLVFLQYTGLKDKNGKEIYEGDLVERLYWTDGREGSVCKGKIQWATDDACFEIDWFSGSPYGGTDMLDGADKVEVIGNIYENKELLEDTNG